MRPLCCALLWFYVAIAQPAVADGAGTPFEAGVAAFDAGDYERALGFFAAALDAGLEGPAVHYNIAVANYKLGRYRAAASEFALIADRYPAMRGLAEYNLGLVSQKVGQPAAAKRHFQRAARSSDDEKIRLLAERQLSAPAASNPTWYGSLSTRVGHDDNVRLLSSDSLAQYGLSSASSSTELTAIVSGPLSSGPGLRFDGSLYSVRYPDASFFDQNFLGAGFAYQWRAGRWLAEAGPKAIYSTLDGDGYEKRVGIGLRIRRSLTPSTTFGLRYAHDDITAGAARFAYVAGQRDWLELRVDHRHAQSRVSVRYSVEWNDRSPDFASSRDELSLLYGRNFNPRWRADVQGSLRWSDYADSTVPRTEDLKGLSFGLTRTLPGKWEINTSVETSTNSSVDPYSYDRSRFAIAFTKSFY
jgi:tetratricopeptide (TPR) repeat protein